MLFATFSEDLFNFLRQRFSSGRERGTFLMCHCNGVQHCKREGTGRGGGDTVTGPFQMGKGRRESNDQRALPDRPADMLQNRAERKMHMYFAKKLIIQYL